MGQRRKMKMSCSHVNVDETTDVLFSIFQNTANTLTDFYTQSVKQQNLAFDAGQQHSLLKMQEWLVTELQQGNSISMQQIFAYLQEELSICEVAAECGNSNGCVEMNAEQCSQLQVMQSDEEDMNSPDMNMDII